jgi:hypothetical protein
VRAGTGRGRLKKTVGGRRRLCVRVFSANKVANFFGTGRSLLEGSDHQEGLEMRPWRGV